MREQGAWFFYTHADSPLLKISGLQLNPHLSLPDLRVMALSISLDGAATHHRTGVEAFFFTSGGVGDVPVHVHVELLLLLLQRVVNGTALLVSLRTAMESC